LQADIRKTMNDTNRQTCWQNYYPPEVCAQALALRQIRTLRSTGVELHLDVYAQAEVTAPVLILNHGGGGYGGLFVALALAFHARGYCVIVPDQKGQGRSGDALGDFTIAEAVENIVDVASWARCEFAGPLYLMGGSIGGGLTYYAGAELVAAGLPPAAIACLNLYDFGDPRTAVEFTRFAGLARVPGLATLMSLCVAGVAALWPGLRLPYRPLAKFRNMLDERDLAGGFHALWQADPNSLRTVTARYFASVMRTAPAIPMAQNRDLAVLVINQRRDRMVRPAVTRDSAARLGGETRYAEIDWGHFSLQPDFNRELADLADAWFRQHPAA